jgi:hypothetical protein
MESYEVLEKAIPRKSSERVAQLLGVTATYVRRWRREPESDDAPSGSGQRSILDRICDLIDAVFLVNPQGVPLIVEYVNNHYKNLINTHAATIECHEKRAAHCADLLRETTEAVNRLNIEGCSPKTLQELIEMRDAASRSIAAVR